MSLSPHFEAEVTLLRTEEGGRKTAVSWGYRPQLFYEGEDWDAEHEYPDVERLNPGETTRVLVRLCNPPCHVGRIQVGTAFQLREGGRIVGFGQVTRILRSFESQDGE